MVSRAVTRSVSLTICFVGLLCLTAAPVFSDDAVAARFRDSEDFARFVAEGRDSPFGLDYVFVHSPGARNRELVDKVCATVGVRWVNFARLEWKMIERRAPNGRRHQYNWRDLDRAVHAWQRNGIHIMISMRFESPWATAKRTDKDFVYLSGIGKRIALIGADYLPKPQYLRDLRDYMTAVVERYDGDGREDMPGLLFPVRHYQIGNEYSNEVFWAGSVEEYGQLLRLTAEAARTACPNVQIVLSGIGFLNICGFYGTELSPRTRSYVELYQAKVPDKMVPFLRRTEQFSATSARFIDAYDVLDARWPDYGIVAASRELLKRVGAPDKPIWSAEIYSGFPLMEPLVLPNWTLRAWPTPSRSRDYLKILKNKDHPQFEDVNRWYRAMQAAQVVKICMVALSAGSQKLMMGWAVDAQHPLAVSTLSHHGLYSATFRHFWPAAHTYNLLIQQLDGVQSVRRLPHADSIYVYDCSMKDGKQVLIAFCDDHIGQNHDEPMATTNGTIRVPWRRVQLTHIITEIGQTQPRIEFRKVSSRRLKLTLTEHPVFIESTP